MDLALQSLQRDLLAQRWAPGARLPAERDLAQLYAVSRPAIRSALAVLVAEGSVLVDSPRIRVVAPAGAQRGRLAGSTRTAAILTRLSSNPVEDADFLQECLRGFVARMLAAGHQVLTVDPGRNTTPEACAQLARQADLGVMLIDDALESNAGLDGTALIKRLLASGCHVVATAESLPAALIAQPPCDVACSDHRAGTAALINELAARGVRRVMSVHPDQSGLRQDHLWWWSERRAGLRQAIASNGMTQLPDLVIPNFSFYDRSPESFAQLAKAYSGFLMPLLRMPEGPQALVLLSDGRIPVVTAALRLLGIDPATIVLVGYDHYWRRIIESRYESQPPALSVDKRSRLVGEALADLLLERAAGTLSGPPQMRVIAPVLITDPLHG